MTRSSTPKSTVNINNNDLDVIDLSDVCSELNTPANLSYGPNEFDSLQYSS